MIGLAAFTAESRTKEVGIRKVLGASVMNITKLLSKEFILLVFISFVIGSPFAWIIMNKWLEDFSYKENIPWWIFILTTCLFLFITLLTVGWQSIQTAIVNPIHSLRDE